MNERTNWREWCIVLRTPGLGPTGLRERLNAANGCITEVLVQLHRQLGSLSCAARDWLKRPDETRLAADLAWLAQPGHRLLSYADADFPPQLENIPQPPVALFVDGDSSLLLRPQVAIVGARGASTVGKTNARAFAHHLALAGFVITSGLADGIDGAAHEAALHMQRLTIAVVGTGLDLVYPRKHRELSAKIAQHGVIVSEFLPGSAARADHFPRRNRIISGLSLGTLVVEAGMQSGSLITARLAAEQGREVFAIPGSIHNPLARGCHRLIKEGARLVESPAEMVEALAPSARALGVELAQRLAQLPEELPKLNTLSRGDWRDDPKSHQLLEAFEHDVAGIDELAGRTGLNVSTVSSMLLMLELEGQVEGLPGGRYQRLLGV